ncbi:MAG: bifunctional pyr operon transcriptional regulator/uracil phosphoribosyltransferase PyrR [Candidatus Moranbacteria bacterium]|nr:bifunctional pyr operon transcriptional regulator/uracil phosphoribosyltransferase PyrR [Candidatus Moranbacteria bacterium]
MRMKEIMNSEQLARTLKRMTHEIIERNNDLSELVFVGILRKGYPIAQMLSDNLSRFAEVKVPVYGLDIHSYRDDIFEKVKPSIDTIDIHEKNVILVDDVLYTGRSVRAAMDALIDYGRPSKIQFAVLVDRGHRELPIRADYIGKNIPTSRSEMVLVDIDELSVCIQESSF